MATFEELYNTDSVQKSLFIESSDSSIPTITNGSIYAEEFVLEEHLCSDDELRFGACESSSVKFKIVKSAEIGSRITIKEKLTGNNEYYTIGTYNVYSITPNGDRTSKEVLAYDDMYKIINTNVADWYNGLSFPMSLFGFRDSFFNHLGIQQNSATLPNDNMIITKTINPSILPGKDVIHAICEINGVFGHIDRFGCFDYISINTDSDDVKNPVLISGKYEDYTVEKITKLTIRENSDDVGFTVGSGDNHYFVENNFLAYGMNLQTFNTVANNLLNNIKNIEYTPLEVYTKGNPTYNVGNVFSVTFRDGTTHKSILTNRVLSGIQAITDSISVEGNEVYEYNYNASESSVVQIKSKVNTLSRTIDETTSEIVDLENNLVSRINQSAESVSIQANKINLIGDTTIAEFNIGTVSNIHGANGTNVTYNESTKSYTFTNGMVYVGIDTSEHLVKLGATNQVRIKLSASKEYTMQPQMLYLCNVEFYDSSKASVGMAHEFTAYGTDKASTDEYIDVPDGAEYVKISASTSYTLEMYDVKVEGAYENYIGLRTHSFATDDDALYIGDKGISVGKDFSVDMDGNIKCSSISVNGSSILNWTKLGSCTGTTDYVALNTVQAKEYFVSVSISGKCAYQGVILKEQLSSTNQKMMLGGYFLSTSDFGLCNLNMTTSRVRIRNYVYAGESFNDTAVMDVWYR